MNSEWQALAENVVKASKILIKKNLCGAFGHVSARLPGSECFLITPRSSLALINEPTDIFLSSVILPERRMDLQMMSLCALPEARIII